MSKLDTSTWRGRVKLVAFSLLPALLLLLIAQLFAYLSIQRDFFVEEDPISGTPYLYVMKFGKGPLQQVSRTPLNSLGFPDKEFPEAGGGKGDCIHVVLSGDSFAFGDAVDCHENFFSLVERAATARLPDRCVRFFNLGERMTTIDRQASVLRELMDRLEPDIVLLAQYQNDISDLINPGAVAYVPPSESDQEGGGAGWGDVIRQRVPFSNAALVRFLSYRAFAFMISAGIPYDILHQWSVIEDDNNSELAVRLTGIYRELYLDLVDELRSKGIDFGVIILPSKLDILAGRYPEEEFFVSLAEEAGVPFTSTFDALNTDRSSYTYQMYDGHLSPYGNQIVAGEIVEWLFDPHSGPFPLLHPPVDNLASSPGSGP